MQKLLIKKNRILTGIILLLMILLKLFLAKFLLNDVIYINLVIFMIIFFYALYSALFFTIEAIIENYFVFILFLNPKVHSYITGTDYNSLYYQGFFKVHISTVYLIISFGVLVVFRTILSHRIKISKPLLIDVMWITYILYISLLTFYFRGLSGIPVILDVHLSGYIAYLLFRVDGNSSINSKRIVSFLVKLLFVNIAIGISEIILRDNFLIKFFTDYNNYEFEKTGILRALGLTDQPLSFALLNILLLYLGFCNKYTLWQLAGICGIFISYSRAAIILSLVFYSINFFINLEKKRDIYKFITVFIVTVSLILLLFPSFKLRNEYASESIKARVYSFEILSSTKINFLGTGIGSNADFLKEHLLEGYIAENPWLILKYDIGLIGIFLLVVLYIYLYVKHQKNKHFFLLLILFASTYNSFGVKNYLWSLVTFVFLMNSNFQRTGVE